MSEEKSFIVQPGDYIIRDGETSTQMFFLVKGELAVTKVIDGSEKELGKIDPGQLAGEMSFLDKKLRSADVKAVTECELLEIEEEKFENFLEELPDWVRTFQSSLIARLRAANERIAKG